MTDEERIRQLRKALIQDGHAGIERPYTPGQIRLLLRRIDALEDELGELKEQREREAFDAKCEAEERDAKGDVG